MVDEEKVEEQEEVVEEKVEEQVGEEKSEEKSEEKGEAQGEEEDIVGSIAKKYAIEPESLTENEKKLAKAYISSQAEYGKLREEKDALAVKADELSQSQIDSQIDSKIDRRIQQGQPPADARAQVIEAWQKRYPAMDEEQIGAMLEMTQAGMANMRHASMIDKANDNVTLERERLNSDPLYKRYQKEIETMIDKQPLEMKQQKGMVKRVRDLIVGGHFEELSKELTAKGTRAGQEQKRILGEVGVEGAKPSLSGGKTRLTPEQEKQWLDMGGEERMTQKDFLEIDNHRLKMEQERQERSK